MVNEKTGEIVDLENGTAKYNADLINRIEKALGVKIPRGRKNKKAKKHWAVSDALEYGSKYL